MQTWERVTIERSFDTWYKYSRSRFKRIKLLRRYLRNWNKDFHLRQKELQRTKDTKRFLQLCRITRSMKVWTEGLTRSRQLYAYQLHSLQNYIQNSTSLLLPFQDESEGLTLRQCWNGVSSLKPSLQFESFHTRWDSFQFNINSGGIKVGICSIHIMREARKIWTRRRE